MVWIEQTADYFLTLAPDIADEVLYAGVSALQALRTARLDEFFDSDDINIEKTDPEDPQDWDASKHAAEAYTYALKESSESKTLSRRRQFWEWWLQDAILTAWEAVKL